ncbi:MAG: hypothetical protein SH817_19240 [Leptospira sp.]|nr:hypothetical protein [Leptospira sp.]
MTATRSQTKIKERGYQAPNSETIPETRERLLGMGIRSPHMARIFISDSRRYYEIWSLS